MDKSKDVVNVTINNIPHKRKHDEDPEDMTEEGSSDAQKTEYLKETKPNGECMTNSSHKYKVEEGFSWWTCLQLGLPLEKSQPQRVPLQK